MTSLARLGFLVSNISWSSSSRKHHRVAPRPRNHPSTPNRTEPPASDWQSSTYRNTLRCVRNDELRLVCCKRSIPCPEKWPGSEWGLVATWLPFSIYQTSKDEEVWKKGHFIGLHVLNRCLVQSFKQKECSEGWNKLHSKKKKFDVFQGKEVHGNPAHLLWTVHPPVHPLPPGNPHSLELGSLVTLIAVIHPNLCKKKHKTSFILKKKHDLNKKQHENSEIILEFPRQESTKRRFFFG